MSENLRRWLRWTARLADEPLKLSKSRLAKERAAAFSLTARGWALLAGEVSDDEPDRIEQEIVDVFNRLLPYRKKPRGRKEGSVTEHTAQLDRAMLAELDAGNTLRGAAKKVGPNQIDTHRRRQQRRNETLRKLTRGGG